MDSKQTAFSCAIHQANFSAVVFTIGKQHAVFPRGKIQRLSRNVVTTSFSPASTRINSDAELAGPRGDPIALTIAARVVTETQ